MGHRPVIALAIKIYIPDHQRRAFLDESALANDVAIGGGLALLTGFTAAMLGMRLSRCVSLNLPHGGLGVLDVFQNGVRIASWNPDALRPD